MKIFIILATIFSITTAAANTLTNCKMEDLNQRKVVMFVGDSIYKNLKVDTSWVNVEDCPRLIGVKFQGQNGVNVEYHSLYSSESNTEKATQTCFYNFNGKKESQFSNITCSMKLE